MKGARALAGWLLVVASTCAQAHAHLQQATPADGSVLDAAPAQLVLHFSEAAQLTTLSIAKDGGAQQKLAPLPEKPQATIVVALPALTAGHYVVTWRAVSADGHLVPGQIHFTLAR
jgi:methionine-rich copper-binding protein CopC